MSTEKYPPNTPAFPQRIVRDAGDEGLMIRDFFAAAVMTGLIANPQAGEGSLDAMKNTGSENAAEAMAIVAYMTADAMLKERMKAI